MAISSCTGLLPRCLALVLLSWGVCVAAHAHGIWFAQRSGDLALIYGEGGDDLDAAKRLPLVKSISGYDPAGRPVATALDPAGKLALVDLRDQPAVVAAVLDNGVWTRSSQGQWLKKPKNEVPDAALSGHNFKYAVHLRAPLERPLASLPGHSLQISPVNAVLPAMRGQPLQLRVLYRGKPAAGVPVLADFVNDPDGETLMTAADGTVTVPVRNQGLNVIAAKLDAPAEDPVATDKVEHLATLSFRLAHAPE
ncbi:DUF4198 domain-containing protein [uncultured Variovorax sp.]|uniref:DUF4198 domain-containing protein n=1 Tax=uncultured Variovorax sp. TaxID=114708 RepID=UPI0025D566A8|nr:DUF4198 domain-containing protein [uncultured Variovorax sp.]